MSFARLAIVISSCFVICCLGTLSRCESAKFGGEPYELLGKRIVFTDWYFVRPGIFTWIGPDGQTKPDAGPWDMSFARYDYPEGIRLVAEKAKKIGPLLEPNAPWEKPQGLNFATVIEENGKYRAWGSWWGDGSYYESEDGLKWTRPKLGLVDFQGSKENNLLPIEIGISTVFVDPVAKPEERYKLVWNGWVDKELAEKIKRERPESYNPLTAREDTGHYYGVRGAVSPDGLRWTWLPEPLTVEHSDTQVTGWFDRQIGKYVLYTRNYMIGPRAERYGDAFWYWFWASRRSIGRTESKDFSSFPASQTIIVPDPSMSPSDMLYMNCFTTIPRAPDFRLMFPSIWSVADDTVSVRLMSSYDGKVWYYVPGEPVLETGNFGEWDGGCIFANPNLVELPNGDWALPYTGFIYPHKYPRGTWKFLPGMAIWPKGRLVAIEAKETGQFSTLAFYPPGKKLLINAVTKRAGKILVEVVEFGKEVVKGRTFEDCKPIIGDCFKTPVTWEGGDDLGVAEGVPIILRFKLDKAKIYCLDFVE